MQPPLDSIPDGDWLCAACETRAKAQEAKAEEEEEAQAREMQTAAAKRAAGSQPTPQKSSIRPRLTYAQDRADREAIRKIASMWS